MSLKSAFSMPLCRPPSTPLRASSSDEAVRPPSAPPVRALSTCRFTLPAHCSASVLSGPTGPSAVRNLYRGSP